MTEVINAVELTGEETNEYRHEWMEEEEHFENIGLVMKSQYKNETTCRDYFLHLIHMPCVYQKLFDRRSTLYYWLLVWAES